MNVINASTPSNMFSQDDSKPYFLAFFTRTLLTACPMTSCRTYREPFRLPFPPLLFIIGPKIPETRMYTYAIRTHCNNNILFFMSAVLADAHFPAHSVGKEGAIVIRADGIGIPELLDAILQLIELDTYVYSPVCI